MNVETVVAPLADVEADWLAIGIFENEVAPPESVRGTALGALLARMQETKDVSGGLGDLTPVHGATGLAARSVLMVGLGRRERFGAGQAYDAGVALAKRLASKPRATVALALPDAGEPLVIAAALTAGAIVGTRGPGLRKTEAGRQGFGTVRIVAPQAIDGLDAAALEGATLGRALNLARDLANTPPAEKPPRVLAERARAEALAAGLEVEVWDETRLRAERFGGVLGVSAGSDEPPAFVILRHRNGGTAPTLALVGKGVTFDSGGLSLKPTASMEDMKSDMTGAAVVLATLIVAARRKLPVNVTGYLVLTENMTGGRALKLGDVLTMRNGKTVEVMNTDAEGRLILADALSYAVEQGPGQVIDLATLTGACLVALGTKYAGLFGNNDDLCEHVQAASRQTGERVWRLPLDEDFQDLIKSSVADLKNVGGKWGGAITAAKFLQQFVGTTPWAHLDIAGPSWADSESATRDAGGTGCFVRTLVALLETEAAKQAGNHEPR